MTIITSVTDKKMIAELWSAPVVCGPYKRTDAVITREFIALQSRQSTKQLVANAPNWFGVPAGVFAALRRPNADGSGKLGKNGWTAELLMEHNGETKLLSGLTIGEINALPSTAFVRIVNVKPADPVSLASHYTQTAFVRGSQRLPDADRNPVSGAILKPDTTDAPASKPDAPIVAQTLLPHDADGVVIEPEPAATVEPAPNRKTRRAAKSAK